MVLLKGGYSVEVLVVIVMTKMNGVMPVLLIIVLIRVLSGSHSRYTTSNSTCNHTKG